MRRARPVKRSFLAQCGRDVVDIVGCGLLWTSLGALAAVQAWVLAVGEIELPEFLRDSLQTQLSRQGLRADYDRVIVDATGDLMVQNLRLSPIDSSDPLVSARSMLVRLDAWQLFTGKVRVDEIEGSGLNLFVPAYLSPSGRAEALLAEGQFRLHFESEGRLTVDAVSGRIAGLPVALDGSLTLPAPRPAGARSTGLPGFDKITPIARRLVTLGEQLKPLGELTVRGRVEPDRVILVGQARRIDLGALPPTALPPLTGEARDALLRVEVPFDLSRPPLASASLGHLSLEAPRVPAIVADGVVARLDGLDLRRPDDMSALSLETSAVELNIAPVGLRNAYVSVHAGSGGALDGHAVLRIDGHPWALDYSGTPADGSGVVNVEAHPTLGLMRRIEPLVPMSIPLTTILRLGPPPLLRVRAEFAAGGLPSRVDGHLEGGGAVAYHVPIKEAAGDFTWQGKRLVFENILLRINDSEARGSYEMDVGTMDFRFLLAGRLDPPDIGGWFHDWWPEFWSTFKFPAPAAADVEVKGRWGDSWGTTVFVAAESPDCSLRGQPLSFLRTRLFIRPGWYDALAFRAVDHDGGAAEGTFGLATDPQGDGRWDRLDFNLVSTLPTPAIVKLLGPESAEILEPYEFSHPPLIQVFGRVAGREKRELNFTVATDRPFVFEGFKLDTLELEGRMHDDVLTLEPMRAHFGGGLLSGRAIVSGPEGERWIAIDHRLVDARLDAVLDLLAARAQQTGQAKPETTAPRRPGGVLNLTLQANGPIAQLEKLEGNGRAEIIGARFAQVSLLGKLSDVLKATGLGFTSLSLENLRTDYRLANRRLTFPILRLSGPSAVVDASGHYFLDGEELDFKAKLYPYESKGGILGTAADFVLSPLSKALEFRLSGKLDKPDWTFTYGPRGLLRSITGGNEPAAPKSDEPANP